MTYTLKTRAINSKRLLADIRQIEQVFTEYQIIWSNEPLRSAAIDMIDGVMEEVANTGRITQWNVVCDYRNNTVSDMANGKFNVMISYRQTNCLNTTILEYTIIEEELDLDFELEF